MREIGRVTTQNPTQDVDYTTIADRLSNVGLSNNGHPSGVVKLGYERSIFTLTVQIF